MHELTIYEMNTNEHCKFSLSHNYWGQVNERITMEDNWYCSLLSFTLL